MINALTVDFEDWYQGLEIPLERWDGYEDRLAVSGRRLLRLFAEAGVRGTFFVLGVVAERCPELVGEIAAGGHVPRHQGTPRTRHLTLFQERVSAL